MADSFQGAWLLHGYLDVLSDEWASHGFPHGWIHCTGRIEGIVGVCVDIDG